jgi:hypothetical protein
MARLCDFQKSAPVRSTAADALLAAHTTRIRDGVVNWRKTKITEQGGARESDPYRAIATQLGDRRAWAHEVLDRVIEERESASNDEPSEEAEDAEPEEASDEWLQSLQRQLDAIPRADVRQGTARQRPTTVDHGAARVISSQHKVRINQRAGYVNDSEYISRYLHPEMLCADAELQLQDVVHEHQKNDANRGYWSGLYFFLNSQPPGSKIQDIENKACLSMLLNHTLGDMVTPFGV